VSSRRSHLVLVFLIVLALIGTALLAVPGSPLHRGVTKGLDLQGGLEVVLKVQPPLGHKLTLAYAEKFKLETYPFTMGNPKTYIHLQGKKVRAADFDPAQYDFDVTPKEKGKNPQELVDAVVREMSGPLSEDDATLLAFRFDR